MNLTSLQNVLSHVTCSDFEPCEIRGLTYDSRRVQPDFAFFAITGNKDDGHRYAQDALERGARALVLERPIGSLSKKVPQLVVRDARRALAEAARVFYGAPSAQVKVSAITGTNGKTSTTYLTQAILHAAGYRAGRLTTVTNDLGSRCFAATHTTPESVEVQEHLSEMREAGLHFAVMEASSHALDQGRLHGVDIESAVFTNLTPDHLDYHGDMERYRDSKSKLFEMLPSRSWAILNADDPASMHLVRRCRGRQLWYGLGPSAEVSAVIHQITQGGTRLTLRTPEGSEELLSPLPGRHNVYNVLAAAANAQALGAGLPVICAGIAGFTGVPGRLQRVEKGQPFSVLVDYAHTADALRNVLHTVRPLLQGGRLLLVFGCGGDRDRTKRPRMAEAAEELSDFFWVTSDNPRTESPKQIFKDILSGLTPRAKFELEPDRRRAIEAALSAARHGDIVLIAGKGHENYQIVGQQRLHFDDVEVAGEVLDRLGQESLAALTLGDAARVLGDEASSVPHVKLAEISTDSRSVGPSALFVALRGENYDGHDFVGQAAARGAAAAVVESRAALANVPPDFPLVRVSDTLEALGQLARLYRSRSQATFIGITGSNGKTTVKTFTATLLGGFGHVCGSPKSFNNHIGVPLTLLSIRPEHRWVVLEMGTNHYGELKTLAELAQPEIAVVTSIGDTHLEFLSSREGVARAKAELVSALPERGVAVLNADDPFFSFLRGQTRARVMSFSMKGEADIFASEVCRITEGYRFRVNGSIQTELRLPGEFNVRNALAALAVGRACGLGLEELVARVGLLRLPPLRMELKEIGPFCCILDAYNANPSSMSLALEEFGRWECRGRKIFVLGEMKELGESSKAHHEAVGRKAAQLPFDLLVAVGGGALPLARAAAHAGVPAERIRHFRDSGQAAQGLLEELCEGDTLFLKGSRAVALERIVEILAGGGTA